MLYRRILKVCGMKFDKWGDRLVLSLRCEEEFFVPMKQVAQHQYFRSTARRMNRLMTAGRRTRGDVGLLV